MVSTGGGGVGEAMQTGGTREGGRVIREGDGALQFDGSCWMGEHNNQPKASLIVGIFLGEMARRTAAVGEDAVESFRPSDFGQKNECTEIRCGFGGRQSSTARNNQPNERGGDGKGMGEDAQPSGNTGGAVFDRYGGRQVGRGDKNI